LTNEVNWIHSDQKTWLSVDLPLDILSAREQRVATNSEDRMAVSTKDFHVFETVCGFAAIAWNDRGVTALRLPDQTSEHTQRALLRRFPRAKLGTPQDAVARAIADIRRYFEGGRVDFTEVRLDLTEPDLFLARVYSAVRQVRWGETTSYGTIARRFEAAPERARDVGRAMARNPVPLIIPCHRVLGAGGRLGGFSAPGGVRAKAKMLALEGITPVDVESAVGSVQETFGF
jgi:methylated-DNA-[protein]-cysteine S-methyltransferase